MKRCVKLAALALCVGFLGIGRATAAEAMKVPQATPAEVGKKAQSPDTSSEGQLQPREPTAAEVGTMVTCHVMGTKFEVAKTTPVIDYKGKSYFFCCENCVHEFQKNPDKFAMK